MKHPRKQIFNIRVIDQCDQCVDGEPSDIFDCEWLCHNDCEDVILYPEHKGTKVCPYFKKVK